MREKVELLAPAGNYEAFLGAVNAGADAVYLGGNKFGARAYAENFTPDEICRVIHAAHFMGKRIYLTVNTLIKDSEIGSLYDWLLPFYEAGLDGVIVQDLGALCFIREHFKGLALHASTQMTITGADGALFLKEQGVERIVPARELSLEEVRRLKEQTGLEIECFIHGAMCYCYSGQCLFSSMLGGRSGNRGRCAQPCRLPYQIFNGGERFEGVEYPLSLKDMCTISYIPQLIAAGIDSFKIEGRMKKPEYAAGVTALYRKYIDLYKEVGAADYRVTKDDLENLQSLYIRSEVQNGYYEQHNGRNMITLHKPSYTGSDKELLEQIRLQYLHEPEKLPVRMHISLKEGEPAYLRVTGSQGASVTVNGDTVEAARKRPLQYQDVKKQMEKTGNSLVKVSECEIDMQEDVFLPVSALNELRRKGVQAYERQCIIQQAMTPDRKQLVEFKKSEGFRLTESVDTLENDFDTNTDLMDKSAKRYAIDILVSSCEQLTEAIQHPCRRIYIDSDLYLTRHEQVIECMMGHSDTEYYLALPYVLRERDKDYLRHLTRLIVQDVKNTDNLGCTRNPSMLIRGFLIRNLEEAVYVRNLGKSYVIIPDAGLYVFNAETMRFWSDYCKEYTLPYELNAREAGMLAEYAQDIGMHTVMVVYGRIPMMITANCIRKTAGQCNVKGRVWTDTQPYDLTDVQRNAGESIWIRDRYATDFPVETNCIHCYNIIYNSVPYSLHLQEKELCKIGAEVWRYDFTVESGDDCRRILDGGVFPYEKYTTGHLKRGVE